MSTPTGLSAAWSGPCWERTALTALALLLAGLALTGVAGPLLDPHFAERQPGHTHHYPGGEALSHTHDASGAAQGGEGTVYLPPKDDATPGLGGFGATLALAGVLVMLAALPLLRASMPLLRALLPVPARPPGPPPPRAILTALLPA
ncbi:MAG: hypothetical protein VW450_05125 [Chloroflexota bacterium]